MKKELHIKWFRPGYMVCYKDGKVWRSYSPAIPRDEAVKFAENMIDKAPREFVKNVCDCGTEAS